MLAYVENGSGGRVSTINDGRLPPGDMELFWDGATAGSRTSQAEGGEYSLVKQAAAAGLVDERSLVLENLLAMRRAGADLIITYHGRDLLRKGWLT